MFVLRANYVPPVYYTPFPGSLWTSPDIAKAVQYDTEKQATDAIKTLPPVNRDRWRVVPL